MVLFCCIWRLGWSTDLRGIGSCLLRGIAKILFRISILLAGITRLLSGIHLHGIAGTSIKVFSFSCHTLLLLLNREWAEKEGGGKGGEGGMKREGELIIENASYMVNRHKM